ncbi:MAG TPA: hypothetical protein VFA18_18645, partial [Gemmataceae bacterium]|nr:hypothetical protein [Gemmataceae bacterium]
TVTLGSDHDKPWASEAWEEAYRKYLALGHDSAGKRYMGLSHTPAEIAAMPAIQRGMYWEDRMVTNYSHWLAVTNLEREPAAVRARKKLAQAKRDLRTYGEARALQDYEDPDAFGPPSTWDPAHCTGWKKLLLDPAHKDYRDDEDLQEDLYKLQNEYLQVFRKVRIGRFNQAKLVLEAMARAGTPGQAGQLPQPSLELGWLDQPVALRGPFDDVDSTGKPVFISDAAKPNNPIPLEKQSPEQIEAMKKMAEQKMKEMQKRTAR